MVKLGCSQPVLPTESAPQQIARDEQNQKGEMVPERHHLPELELNENPDSQLEDAQGQDMPHFLTPSESGGDESSHHRKNDAQCQDDEQDIRPARRPIFLERTRYQRP